MNHHEWRKPLFTESINLKLVRRHNSDSATRIGTLTKDTAAPRNVCSVRVKSLIRIDRNRLCKRSNSALNWELLSSLSQGSTAILDEAFTTHIGWSHSCCICYVKRMVHTRQMWKGQNQSVIKNAQFRHLIGWVIKTSGVLLGRYACFSEISRKWWAWPGQSKILKFGAVMAMTNSCVLCSTLVGILCFAIIPG